MSKYLLIFLVLVVVLSVSKYKGTKAYFNDTATSFTNTFTTAESFGTTVTPTPSVLPGKIVINEVFSNASASAEWVELYNSGGSRVDISNWKISDQNTLNTVNEDVLPVTQEIQPGSYAVIVTHDTVVANIPVNAQIIHLNNDNIGSGLNNIGGDSVYLKNSSNTIIDQMGYGSTDNVFGDNQPGIPTTTQSARRIPNGIDTDAASDWEPGTPSIGISN